MFRMIVMWSITFVILISTFIAITVLQIYQNKINDSFSCPPDVSKKNAYIDVKLPSDKS
jgi:hypothetical protein